jgi:hypothetical protein
MYTTTAEMLKRFEINQCFQDVNEADGTTQVYDLIETKPFVARITLERIKPGATSAKVKLQIFHTVTGEQIGKTKEKPATIKYGTPETVDILFNDDETRNMKAGDYKFSLVVEDSSANKLLEQNLTYQFRSSKTVRMLAVKYLFYNLQTGVWNDSYVSFTEQVFPVPKTTARGVNRLEIAYLPSLLSGLSLNLLLLQMQISLLLYNLDHLLAPADFICAVVPDGVLPGNAIGLRSGSAVVIEPRSDSQYILGHETGHIYTLGEEYIDSQPQNANGLWVLDQTFYFDGNPPPLKLAPSGPFIIAAGRRNAGQRCDWADDTNSYENPLSYSDQQGNIRWWCTGRYVLQEAYDVAGNRQVPSSTFSMMSAATGSSWMSGPEYQTLISELVSAPLKLAASAPTTLSAGQNRVLVSGIVDIPAKTAEISPLISDPNLVPTAEVTDPNCLLIFISQLGVSLGSFGFGPMESELPNSHLKGPFCVVVDLPQDTARIQVTIDGIVVAELQLTENSPTVTVISPNGGEQISGEMSITWSASDADINDTNNLRYTVEFSHDNGTEWSALVIDHDVNELTVDSNYLPGGPNCLVKVIASDGWNLAEDVSNSVFSITTKPPEVTILDPEDGTILLSSESMQGRCTAYDPETGDINDPNAIVWSSNVDGFLGNGDLVGFQLSVGEHILSATATDPESKIGMDTVSVKVLANASDFNCDNRVNFLDLSKFAEKWQATCSPPNWCEGADLDRSGIVDYDDLAKLVENWLWQAVP